VLSTVPVIQDLELSAWGFGTGMRAFAQFRGRGTVSGSSDLWPRSDDALDVLALYGEIERARLRVRAGRQWKVSGLGFYNFDGVDVDVSVSPALTLEGYAGRSLVRGLNGGRTGGALESIESLATPSTGVLFGVNARYRPMVNLALSALYQIDFRADGRGVYSELAVANGVFNRKGATAEAAVELDVATLRLNQASLQLRAPLFKNWLSSAELRRYRPYFELWTIWGAFSPVGFDEARATLTWANREHRLVLRGEASYRSYGVDALEQTPDALRTDGWGVGTSLSWSPRAPWRIETAYRVESGYGASGRDGHLSVIRQLGPTGSIALQGLVFQRLYEFQLPEGTVVGLGAEMMVPISARSQLLGSAMLYRHLNSGSGAGLDWSQRRVSVRVLWTIGSEPGIPVAVRGRQ
jgi:hypothetical protein